MWISQSDDMAARGNRRPTGPASLLPMAWHLAAVVLVAAVVFAGAAALLWAGLGSPALTGAQALSTGARFDLVKIALSVVAGVGGVVALVVAYRRQRLSEAAEHRETVRLFNERFTSACTQLGDDAAAVRLGGVYALAGLADDWADQRQVCIDVLCSYLRMPYEPEASDWHHDGETEIRLSVTRVISEHLRDGAPISWRGHNLDFTRATFWSADFDGAHFTGGRTSFSLARFLGGRTSFNGARVTGGWVSFGGAEFAGGRVQFRYARFAGGRVTFEGAAFTGADVDFTGAEFAGAEVDLSGVSPHDYRVPPRFDRWDSPPPGLTLPASAAEAPR